MKQNIKKGRYLFYDGEVYDLGGGDDGQAMAKAEEALTAAQAAQQTADDAQTAADDAQTAADDAQTAADGKAPIYHASENNTYGVGDYLHYGHVKLADTPNSSQQAGDGYAATPAAVQSAIDAMGWDLLWENASPTSAFAAQTVSIPAISGHTAIVIEWKHSAVNARYTTIAFVGQQTRLERFGYATKSCYMTWRDATVSSTGVTFTAGSQGVAGNYAADQTTNNNACIPLRIWGV